LDNTAILSLDIFSFGSITVTCRGEE